VFTARHERRCVRRRATGAGFERLDPDSHFNDPAFADVAAAKLLNLIVARAAHSSTPHSCSHNSFETRNFVMPLFPRQDILARLRAKVAAGRPIVGGGAGTGLSAKMSEAGGIDLLVIYNSGRFRMAGRGSLAGMLPYGDANAIVLDMAREVIPVVSCTPVLAGVCGTDPFRVMKLFLREVDAAGFSGVQNFPTVGLFDGTFRANLEETGMGYGLEVDLIATAHELGMLTTPYCFNPDEARAMAEAGADILIPHLGLTTKGTIGAQTATTLEAGARRVQAMCDAARRVNRDILVLCHGGPVAEPADAQYVLDHTEGVVGFYGASSMERLPVEPAIRERVREFTELKFRRA
jgi:predicted TIM-barrel enzyme